MMDTSSTFPMQTVAGKDNEDDDLVIDTLLTCSTRMLSNDDEEDDSYVPESLASFVRAFDVALEEAKQNFFETIATPKVRQEHQDDSTMLDDSDFKNTPLPNPANDYTASGAKRELQIRTNPGRTDNAREYPASASSSVKDTPSTFFPTRPDGHMGDPRHEEVLSSGDFNNTISPIAAVASPLCVPSPQSARQKLFDSPRSTKSHTPDRAKSIRETVKVVSRQQDLKEAAEGDATLETKGSSSPSRSGTGTSASKRRTQFIKARKSIASKRVGAAPAVAATALAAIKTSNSSPFLFSRMMKGTTGSRAKQDEEEDPISPVVESPDAGQQMASTMGDSLTSDIATTQIPAFNRESTNKVVVSTVGDSPTSDTASNQAPATDSSPSGSTMGDFPTSDIASNQVPAMGREPSGKVVTSTMGDSQTSDIVSNQAPASQKVSSGKVMANTIGDSPTSDIATPQAPALKRASSGKAVASKMSDSLTSIVVANQAPASKPASSSEVVVSTNGDSLTSNVATNKTPASQRARSGKFANRTKVDSLISNVATNQAPVSQRAPSGKVATRTKDDSRTRNVATDRVSASKSAPSSKAVRPIRIESRDKENHTSTESNKTKKPTLDEKIAAARERARLRNLEKEALLTERIASKAKCSMSRLARSLDARRLQRPVPRTAPVSSNTRAEKPKVTIPQSPKFATNYKLGVRKLAPSASIQPSLARSTDVLRKGLRSQESIGTHIRRAGLTVPKTPKFATDRRPKQRFITPGTRAGTMTLAQSSDMHRRGLRTMPAPVSKRSNGLTIPKSPKFQTTTKRALPQSTAEKEAEIMSYYKSHPFKAGPIMKEIPQEKPKPRRPCPSSNALPFRLRAGTHVVTAARLPPVAKKEQDDQNTQFRFLARPMPDFFRHSTSIISAASQKPQTKPIPFHLSSDSKERVRDKSGEVAETYFRARPLPKTTYEYHPPPKTPPRVTSHFKSPGLATAERSVKHDAIIQISRARVEALSAEKEAMQKARQREQHKEALKKADLFSPRPASLEKIKPFDLQSTKRHEIYVKQMEEKKRQEEEERIKQMEFHARSFHPSPAPTPVQSPRALTQPEPFNVSGMDSVEAGQAAARKKFLQKEEERKSKDQISPFKARRVPSSTYTSPSSLASRSSPQVSFRACRTPTRASPSTAEVAQSSYHNDSPSDISDSRDSNGDEIEIEFMECDIREADIGQFLSA